MKLYETKHPYYATEGCYYVSGTLGHPYGARGFQTATHDGNTCHATYASWADFKAGDAAPYSPEMLEARARAGIKEQDPNADNGPFGKFSFYNNCDDDLNLLYRFDWNVPDPGDYKEGEDYDKSETLQLYYMLQRKARPQSVHVTVTREDEPEIRAWLAKKWQHLQRLWTPFAPDIEVDASDEARAERTLLHYGGAEPLKAGAR